MSELHVRIQFENFPNELGSVTEIVKVVNEQQIEILYEALNFQLPYKDFSDKIDLPVEEETTIHYVEKFRVVKV